MNESKLKPFNLEAALAGKKVVSKAGLEAVNICYLPQAKLRTNRVYAVLLGASGNDVQAYDENGHAGEGTYDLFMVPTKRTFWARISKPSCANSDSNKEPCLAYIYPEEPSPKDARFVYVPFEVEI